MLYTQQAHLPIHLTSPTSACAVSALSLAAASFASRANRTCAARIFMIVLSSISNYSGLVPAGSGHLVACLCLYPHADRLFACLLLTVFTCCCVLRERHAGYIKVDGHTF